MECPFCHHEDLTPRELFSHMKQDHTAFDIELKSYPCGSPKWICSKCAKSWSSFPQAIRHIQQCEGKPRIIRQPTRNIKAKSTDRYRHVCPICNAQYTTGASRHLKRYHPIYLDKIADDGNGHFHCCLCGRMKQMNLKEVIQHVEQAHPNTTPKVVTPDLAQTRLEFSEAFRACCRNKDPLDVLAWTLTRLLETYKDTIQQKTAENHELRVSKLEDTKKIDYLTAEIDRLKQERQKLIDELEKRDKSQGNLTERIQRALGEPGN